MRRRSIPPSLPINLSGTGRAEGPPVESRDSSLVRVTECHGVGRRDPDEWLGGAPRRSGRPEPLRRAQAHGVRVIIGAVPPAARFPWRPGLAVTDKIKTLNAWLQSYAAATGSVAADPADSPGP